MILPIPRGTRRGLPDEMRELSAISRRPRVFAAAGYGEIQPTLEYESVLARGATEGVGPRTACSTRTARYSCFART